MKTKFFVIAMLVAFATSFTSCKKGPEDPTFSLSSRKARLTAKWNISAGHWVNYNYDSDKAHNPFIPYVSKEELSHFFNTKGDLDSVVYDYNNGVLTVTSDGDSYTKTYSESFEFFKDGTFEYTNYSKSEDNNDWGNYTYEHTSKTNGYWYFLPANKELEIKNKQRLFLEVTKSQYQSKQTYSYYGDIETYTYGDTTIYEGSQNYGYTVTLNELSKDELKVLYDNKMIDEDGDYDQIKGYVTYTREKE